MLKISLEMVVPEGTTWRQVLDSSSASMDYDTPIREGDSDTLYPNTDDLYPEAWGSYEVEAV